MNQRLTYAYLLGPGFHVFEKIVFINSSICFLCGFLFRSIYLDLLAYLKNVFICDSFYTSSGPNYLKNSLLGLLKFSIDFPQSDNFVSLDQKLILIRSKYYLNNTFLHRSCVGLAMLLICACGLQAVLVRQTEMCINRHISGWCVLQRKCYARLVQYYWPTERAFPNTITHLETQH